MIRLDLRIELNYDIDAFGADFILNIHPALTSQQRVLNENLWLSQPLAPLLQTDRHTGNRLLRLRAGPGPLKLVYTALSLVITARIVRPLRGLFVHHTAQSNASLVGQTCKVLTGVVDERQGRAEVAQRGASINVRVWSPSPNTLKRGDTALITEYDAGTHRYLVMPMPPASNTVRCAGCSAKWLRGVLMVITSPSCTLSCMATEPPRDAASRSTAMR